MVQKIPPPPPMPQQFQPLNRWLLELQSVLNDQGTIDPSNVAGLPALITQVGTNTTDIATNTGDIATNTTGIETNSTDIATNAAAIAALATRNQIRNGAGVPAVGLGNNGDLYVNNTGIVGSYLYGKIGGAWIAFA